MTPAERERLREELARLRQDLEERRQSLPAHSVRPHQLLRIEELEDRIAELEAVLGSDGQ